MEDSLIELLLLLVRVRTGTGAGPGWVRLLQLLMCRRVRMGAGKLGNSTSWKVLGLDAGQVRLDHNTPDTCKIWG